MKKTKQKNSKLKIVHKPYFFLLSKDISYLQTKTDLKIQIFQNQTNFMKQSPLDIVFDSLLLPQTVGIPPLFILSNLLNRKLF